MKPTPITDTPPTTAPRPVVNPAGADQLAARVGTRDSFLAAMLARLTSGDYPRLAELRTRRPDDPAIALLDAWATAADVLTFYTERVANEAFLRTARERRSLVELANLVGYRPGPGVAANTFLAFGLEKGVLQTAVETVIPAGTAVKSVPAGNELPQTFETAEAMTARGEWNALRPRMSLPQRIDETTFPSLDTIYLDGPDTTVKANDRVFVWYEKDRTPVIAVVREVTLDRDRNRTLLRLEESAFSVPKMRRQTADAINLFLADADSPDALQFVKDVMAAAKKVLTDHIGSDVPAADMWVSLSQFDDFLPRWEPLKDVTQSDTLAAFKILDDPASEVRQFPELLRGAKAACEALKTTATRVCAEVLQWDKIVSLAIEQTQGIAPLTDPDQFEEPLSKIESERANLSGDLILGEYATQFKPFLEAVRECAKDPQPPSAPGVFSTLRPQLMRWWGYEDNGKPVTSVVNFHKAVTKLNDALAKPFDPDKYAKAIEIAVKAFDKVITDDSLDTVSTPDVARIEVPRDAIKGLQSAAEQAFTKIKAPTTPAPLKTLDPLLKFLDDEVVKKIPTTTDLAPRLAVVREKLQPAQDRVREVKSFAEMIHTFEENLKTVRDAFAKKAATIVTEYADLKTATPDALKLLWIDIEGVLNAVDAAGLKKTLDRFRTPDGDLIKRLSDFSSAGIALAQTLSRELRTLVALDGGSSVPTPTLPKVATNGGGIADAMRDVGKPPPTREIRRANETLNIPLNTAADVVAQLTVAFDLASAGELRARWSAVRNGEQPAVVAPLSAPYHLYGYNAPRQIFDKDLKLILPPASPPADWNAVAGDFAALYLAAELPALVGPTHVIVKYADGGESAPRKIEANPPIVARSDYGLTLKATKCVIDEANKEWRQNTADGTIAPLRTTLVQVPQKPLTLGERPITATIGEEAEDTDPSFLAEKKEIELDGIYLGLRPGHLVIVEGERDKLPGVIGREVRRIKLARHTLRELPGDRVHTRIVLDAPLQFTYVRETVIIHANVVPATHGESVREVLGSGDAAHPFQRFPLRRAPLTYLPAPTPSGVRSTLAVRANDLLWHEQVTLLDSGPAARDYSTATDDSGRTALMFGDGQTGGRLPTGRENVRAEYRVGLGKAGNVRGGAVTQLAHRPLGVKEVTNPLPATGGADPDTPEQIRANAPLGVMALDRLVSVDDYASFTRNYAGIDKAVARRVFVGTQPTVHVTYAGIDDIPLNDTSELIVNLHHALLDLGDPLVDVRLARRELLVLILSAGVGLEPDYEWKSVEPKVRAALYDGLGFARRHLAQPVYLSDVQRIIQRVPGVRYVDVDAFGAVEQTKFKEALNDDTGKAGDKLRDLFKDILGKTSPPALIPVRGTEVKGGQPLPAQLAVLSPDVTDSLFLQEVTP